MVHIVNLPLSDHFDEGMKFWRQLHTNAATPVTPVLKQTTQILLIRVQTCTTMNKYWTNFPSTDLSIINQFDFIVYQQDVAAAMIAICKFAVRNCSY